MTLRQLLGVTCLVLHLILSAVGVYGITDNSQEIHLKPQYPRWNPTGHIISGFSAAAKSPRPSTPSSEGILTQITPSSDQPLKYFGAVLLERPRPLQPLRPLHAAVLGGWANLSAYTSLSSSRATVTPTGASSLFATDKLVRLLGATQRSLTSLPTGLASASTYTDRLRAVRPFETTPGCILASGCNKSSILTWSPRSSISSLAPVGSVIRTTSSDSAIAVKINASATSNYSAAASGTGERPTLVEYLDSIKNRTKSGTGLHPWVVPGPLYARPGTVPIPRVGIGSYATPGRLYPMPPFAMATGSGRIPSTNVNLVPSGTGGGSALENFNESMNMNKTKSRKPERINPHRPSMGLPLSGLINSTFNRTDYHLGAIFGSQYPTNCSGFVTSTAHVVYEILTSTILVNETITLGLNATTPLPKLITPPPACRTITAPCEGAGCPASSSPPNFPIIGPYPKRPLPVVPPINLTPYTPSTSTSTLLVTKKTPAIVQRLSAVGNLFGPSTPMSQAVGAQPNSDGQQATGQKSGDSNSEMSTQSDDSSSSESDSDGQSPQKSTPQQNVPANGDSPSASSNSPNSDSQMPAAGSSGGQSTGSDDQNTSNGDQPNGATSNHGGISKTGDNSGNEGTSDVGSTYTGGGASGQGKGTNNVGASSNGGSSSSEGGAPKAGDVSSNGAALNNGEGLSNGNGPQREPGSSADSHGVQYVSSIVMAGNLPVSVANSAVIVGSHTVNAGSPPTTVVVKGQTIAIQPSQIVAQGKTIPIQAAVTPPPAISATMGNMPVVLRPQDVAIGSKTFEHGSSPKSVVYHGQTYSWDANHLVGAGATVAFPSVDSSAPRVTAGGQVFSVFPSQLKASGRNIVLPSTANASPFVFKGQTFSVNPSQIIAPDTSITLPPANKATPFVYIDHSLSVDASQFMARSTTIRLTSGFGTVTYNGQVLTVKPSEIIGPSTTVALSAPDDSAASPTAITTGGLTFSIGPSAAVVGSSTYSFVPGKAPATIMTHGEAVLMGSNGVQFGNFHIPIPTVTPSFSTITQGDLTFSVAPSKVVVGGHTDNIHSGMTPITTIVNGHTISIGLKGVGLAGTTFPLPRPKPSFSIVTKGDLTFSVAPSAVVVKGKTYSISSNKAPITTAIDGQVVTLGSKGINLKGTSVNLPVVRTPMSVTAGGLTFLVGPTNAAISGTTYAIGSGAPLQTVVVGSQTIKLGRSGVMLPSTTIAPEQTPTAVTANGLIFSMDSAEAVMNGTTYAIGSGAVAKTLVNGSIKMILGTDGVALPSTTIRPWLSAAQTGFSSVLGTPGASFAASSTKSFTPIVTDTGGDKKHAAGISTRVPNSSIILTLVLGILMLSHELI